jgi:hypothetical protein
VIAFYKGLQTALLAQDARARGMNSGGFFRFRRRPVGGVLEWDGF